MDSKWIKAKKYVEKKYPKLQGNSFWEKVASLYEGGFPMMNGSWSEEDIVKDITSQASQSGSPNSDAVAKSAVELAKNKMPQGVRPESPEYGAVLQGLASTYAGNNDPQQGQSQSMTASKPSVMTPSITQGSMSSSFTEDNYYKRASLVVQNSGSDITVYNRDKFDFSLSSNKSTATAIAIESNQTYEIKLRVITKGSTMWPGYWKKLEDNGIDSVLRIFIEGLSIQAQAMNNDPDRQISQSHFDSLSKTISKIVETYNKLWGKTHYQLVVIGTNRSERIPLITSCADELKKLSSFSIKKDLTEIMNEKPTAQWRDFTWVAIKNASGKAFKEEVSSDAFMDAVPENATVVGMPANTINTQAKKNFNKMKRKGFGAQLESKNTSLIDTPVVKDKGQNRVYYLKFPDGTVRAYDNKDERDYYKDTHPEAESVLATEFFDSLLDNEGDLAIEDALHFGDKVTPIATFSDEVKAQNL